jgi:two-component system, chemotaxis family, CheB/CheR fusion protein
MIQPESPEHDALDEIESATSAEELHERSPFPVVGVGASAGGLEAFIRLLSHLPEDTGMVFVLVQHLDPRHESHLGELLGKATHLPVLSATQGIELRPNHVYVIPAGTSLTIARGALQLAPRGDARGLFLPVDHFFKSLAAECRTAAIGVILSGTGSDGTLGVEEIKAAGGFTFAQEEGSAPYPDMPRNAIRSGSIDLILSPEDIARELGRISQHPYVGAIDVRPSVSAPREKDQFKKILALLHSSLGVDFSAYRDTTLWRRITRRAVLHTKHSLADYFQFLERDPGEVAALYHDILINVTSFFREPETFEALKSHVFPALLKERNESTPVRFWVAGCSTGQEAYSLAMAFLEFLENKPNRPALQIFASDLSDTVSLKRAREGVYPKNIEAEVSPERLRRFFTKEDDHYRINKSIRDACVFARQNVAADPPFSRVDLISCRNVLIYLSATLQKRIIPTFHYALNSVGYLLLGHSETVGGFTDLFGVVDHGHRIYVKKATAARAYPNFNAEAYHGTGPALSPPLVPVVEWQREADRVLLNQYAPPGVLVNADLDVLQFRGRTGPYLEPASGEPSHNLLRMAREGLLPELRNAINECRQQGIPIRRQKLRVHDDGRVREVALRVCPVKAPGSGDLCFLVLFEEVDASEKLGQTPKIVAPDQSDGEPKSLFSGFRRWLSPPRTPASARALDGVTAPREREEDHLRQELASTREYLQGLIEQHGAAEEELKSANEEILSGNEELRSTNEELQAAKEELQSLNEELMTVNEQLRLGNQELTRLSDDLTNVLGSANVPMILLGIDFRVQRLTFAATKVLGLVSGDIGRPLRDVKLPFDGSEVEAIATEVLRSVQVEEREVRDRRGRWYMLRVHPYRTADNRIDGVVVVLADIHEVKTANLRVTEALEYARAIVETVRDPLLVLDATLRVRSANRAFYETFGLSSEQTANQYLFDLGVGEWDHPELRRLLEEILPRKTTLDNFELAQSFARVGPKIMLLNARRIVRDGESADLVLLAIEDVTERRRGEAALQESESRYSAIFNQATAGIAQTDLSGRFVLVNQRYCEITGRSREELASLRMQDLTHPDDLPDNLTLFDRLTRGGPNFVVEKRYLRPDGSLVWVRNSVAQVVGPTGQPLYAVAVCTDITEHKQAEEALREAHGRMEERVHDRTAELARSNESLTNEIAAREAAEVSRQDLLRRLATAQEEERRRIARELHDQMGQYLTALGLGLEALKNGTPEASPTWLQLQQLRRLTDAIGQEVHQLALDLRPTALDDLGLQATLMNYVEVWSARTEIEVDFTSTGLNQNRLASAIETALYRIVQEALTNVTKHALARRVSVTLQRSADEVLAVVEDDGRGFDVDSDLMAATTAGRLGVIGMRERLALIGGDLIVESTPGKGTAVFARVPLPVAEGES